MSTILNILFLLQGFASANNGCAFLEGRFRTLDANSCNLIVSVSDKDTVEFWYSSPAAPFCNYRENYIADGTEQKGDGWSGSMYTAKCENGEFSAHRTWENPSGSRYTIITTFRFSGEELNEVEFNPTNPSGKLKHRYTRFEE